MASLMIFLGRLCMAVIFLMAGVNKFMDWEGTLGYMKGAGMANLMGMQIGDMLPVLMVTAALVEILGALCLVFGTRTRFAAFVLALFLIPTTLIFHNFWAATKPDIEQVQMLMFFKNLAIFGGLLVLSGAGAGGLSADARRQRKREAEAEG